MVEVKTTPKSASQLVELYSAMQRAERDLKVAFCQFCADHEISGDAVFRGVRDDVVLVEVPE